VYATLDLLAGQFGEPALDLIPRALQIDSGVAFGLSA
jgi:hypothetical protein